MRKLPILFMLVLISLSAKAQKSMGIGGINYSFEKIDSVKIQINGWWRVVGGEFFYDDDGTPSDEKWDGRDLGKRMLISDTLMQLYSPSAALFYEKPRFHYLTFDLRTSDAGPFFRKFPSKVVGVNIYTFQDAKVWHGKDYDFAYQWFYILNPHFLAYFKGGNEVLYLERITNELDQYGWDEEDGFKIIKYTGSTGYIKLNIEKEQYSGNDFFEVHFRPQANCDNTWFNIETFPNYFTWGDQSKFLIKEMNSLKGNRIFKIPLKEFLSNYIEISLGNCNEEWVLKWKIVSADKIRSIISKKAIIYSSPIVSTKKYLIKGDEIEVLEEQNNWLRIRYYGKETIEGWIRKEDVE